MCNPDDTFLNANYWSDEATILSKQLIINHLSKMEDHEQVVVVDFANKSIGGGSLKKGAVQEEILFLIYPQLYVSILVCEKMDDNEAIYLSNFQRFANYEGYHTTLKFSSSAALTETRRDFIAIDAIKFDKAKNGTMGA